MHAFLSRSRAARYLPFGFYRVTGVNRELEKITTFCQEYVIINQSTHRTLFAEITREIISRALAGIYRDYRRHVDVVHVQRNVMSMWTVQQRIGGSVTTGITDSRFRIGVSIGTRVAQVPAADLHARTGPRFTTVCDLRDSTKR